MINKEDQVREQLAIHGQEHLLAFYNELSADQQSELLADIASIDLQDACRAFMRCDPKNAPEEQQKLDELLEPLTTDIHQSVSRTTTQDLERFRNIGLQLIADGKVASVLLAGGQGTRLGSPLPKGMFDVGLPSGKSLFQIQAERILSLERLAANKTGKTGGVIVWYIMTSPATVEPTVKFFKENGFFGLQQENVIIFEQNTLPCFTFDGKIILDEQHRIARAPDGNGGLYKALRGKGILDDMTKRGIEHVHTYCVDNILVKVTDPIFIGYCVTKNADCAAKVVEKMMPNEAVGIICKVKGIFKVVEYSEVSHQTAQKRNEADGRLLFNAGNICNHYFTRQFLIDTVKEDDLVHHVAKKKIPFVEENSGVRALPDKPNGIKLEKFVFDVFDFAQNFAVWEVLREDEFSPLKNSDSAEKDNPTTARLSLFNLHQRFVLNAGGRFVDEDGLPVSLIPSPALPDVFVNQPDSNNNHVENQVTCEISPLVSYDGENLEKIVNGKTFTSPLCLDI